MKDSTHGGSGSVLKVDHDALQRVKDFFINGSGTIEGCAIPLGMAHDNLLAAVGEFSETMRGGAEEFLVSWAEVFRIEHTAAVVISNNVGKFSLDCQTTDLDFGRYSITA
jgi:hypothetical protein